MRTKLGIGLIGIVTLATALASGRASAEPNVPERFIDPNNRHLRIDVQDSSIDEVLQAIARLSGVKVVMHGKARYRTVSGELRWVSIEEGLRKLVPEANMVFIYAGPANEVALKEIHYYPESTSSSDTFADVDIPGLTPEARARLARMIERQTAAAAETPAAVPAAQVKPAAQGTPALTPVTNPPSAEQVTTRTWTDDAIGPLAYALLRDPSPRVREAAALALRAIGDASTLSALRAALSDSSSWVRDVAADAISAMEPAAAQASPPSQR